jgi:hypothetical protein
MSKDYIEVKVKVKDIEAMLKDKLTGAYNKEVAQIVISNLKTTELGIEQLYNAFSGILPTTDVKVGDSVLINASTLPSWRIDFDKTKEAGFMYQSKMKGIVEYIDLCKIACYRVKYSYVDKSDGGKKEETWYCGNESITVVNEEIPDTEDELPF